MLVPELTACPATEVITSPWARPALAAGVPEVTPAICTPWLEAYGLVVMATPRKAVGPMCTLPAPLPASICLAIDSAVLIGIVKPCVALPDPSAPLEPLEPLEPGPPPNP